MNIRTIIASVFTAAVLLSVPSPALVHRYITIDSGGMLGMIPAHLLQGVEEETGRPMHQLVDGFMGTSTGAIISSLLLVPAPNRDHPYSAKEVLEFYKLHGARIFEAATASAVSNGIAKFMGRRPDFSNAAGVLKEHVDKAFEERSLSDANKRLVILSYNLNTRKTHHFDSFKLTEPTLAISDLVRASSSVADVFGRTELILDGEKYDFIDAGSMGVRNAISDPTGELIKILENERHPVDEYMIYSIGTGFGKGIRHQISYPNIKVIRIEPDVTSLSGGSRNMMMMNLLAATTEPEKLEAMIEIAEALKSSPEYKQMVADLNGSSEKTEL